MISFEEALEAAQNSIALSIDGELYHNLGVIRAEEADPEDSAIVMVADQGPQFGEVETVELYTLLENSEEIMFHPIDYEKTVIMKKKEGTV